MSVTLPRVRIGKTGYRHLNVIIAAVETAVNGAWPSSMLISAITGLQAALDAKSPLASPTFTGAVTVPALIGTMQALSGAGAVDVVTLTTRLTTTGAEQALTLADGTAGQIKHIVHEVDGGSAVLTPTTKTGFTTITFTNVGDSATLQFFATRGWMILALKGAVAA